MMIDKTQKIAKALMDIQAISLNPAHPYTWASGLKAPIYCDNRLIMSFPEVRSFIEEELVALIRSHYPKAEVIAGTATAGIPHAAIIADKMNLPMVYVRSNHKDHGKKNAIEGRIEDRKSTRLNSSHVAISYAVFCLKKKKKKHTE